MSPVMKKRKLQSVNFHPNMQVYEVIDPWMQGLTDECSHFDPELEQEQQKARLWYSSSDLHRMKQEAVKHALCIRKDDAVLETLTDDDSPPLTYSNILSSAYQWCCDTADEKLEFPLPQNHMFYILANALKLHSSRDARGLEFQSVSMVRTERALRRHAVRTSIVRLQQYQQEMCRNAKELSQKDLYGLFADKFRHRSERGSLVAQRWSQLLALSDALEVASETLSIPKHSKVRPYCAVTSLNSNPHAGLEDKEQERLISTSSFNVLPSTMACLPGRLVI